MPNVIESSQDKMDFKETRAKSHDLLTRATSRRVPPTQLQTLVIVYLSGLL